MRHSSWDIASRGFVTIAMASACSSQPAKHPPIDSSSAVDRIVGEMQAHAESCGQGAAARQLSTAKLETLHSDAVAQLGLDRCSTPVDERVLRDCLGEIRQEPCGAELESVASIPTCRVGALCGLEYEATP